MMQLTRCLTLFAVTTFSLTALGNAIPGDPAPAFRANDAAGKPHTLTDYIGNWVVLEWFDTECEAVQAHYDNGTMPKLQKRYREEGVKWLTVISSKPGPENVIEADEALELKDEYEMEASAPILLDDTSVVARAYGVKSAPHIYVINPRGTLVYSGAPGDADSSEESVSYIERTLDAALDGEEVEVTQTEADGCELDLSI